MPASEERTSPAKALADPTPQQNEDSTTNTTRPQTEYGFLEEDEEKIGVWRNEGSALYTLIYKKNNEYYQVFSDGKDRTTPERAVVETQSGKAVYRLTEGIDKAYFVILEDGSLESWDRQGFVSRATPAE